MSLQEELQSSWTFPTVEYDDRDRIHQNQGQSSSRKFQQLVGGINNNNDINNNDTTTGIIGNNGSSEDDRKSSMFSRFLEELDLDHSWFERFNSFQQTERVRFILHRMQIIVGVSLAVLAIIIPEIRSFIIQRKLGGKFTVFILEFGSWTALTILLGRDEGVSSIPVNYGALVIMRIFLSLELQYEYEQEKRQEEEEMKGAWFLRTLYSSQSWISSFIWPQNISTVAGALSSDSLESPLASLDSTLHSFILILICLTTAYLITKLTNIRVDGFGNTVLIGTFIVSTTGSLILVTSLLIPRWIDKETHLMFCHVWTAMSLVAIFILPFYLFQRFMVLSFSQWMRQRCSEEKDFAWMLLEVMLCLIQISIVFRCIPAFHQSFNNSTTLSLLISTCLSYIVPTGIRNIFTNYMDDAWLIMKSTIGTYADAIPQSMRMDNYF